MKMRYIFFEGLIDTLDLYTAEFVKICAGREAECLVLDASRMEAEMIRLRSFLLTPVTAVISCNNIGLHLELEDGQNIWDRFEVPFFNIMMDHPFHYKRALDTAPEQMILLCMDENHAAYARRFFPHIKDVRFFPHGGIELDRCGNPQRTDRMLSFKERPLDVLYAGGLSRYSAEGLVPDLGSIAEFDAFALVQQALERLIREPGLTTETVIEQCLQNMGVITDDKNLGEIITKLRFVDSFAVSFYREQLIRTLTAAGITVTVFGTGWNRVEWDYPSLVYGGEIPPGQILELMNQSKIVLNTMTWFKRGAHDRIFNGMLAGAAVVSDSSGYLLEQFTNGEQMRMFSLTETEHIADTVKYLLDHTQEAQRMADCGYEAARADHMWINRLEGANVYGF